MSKRSTYAVLMLGMGLIAASALLDHEPPPPHSVHLKFAWLLRQGVLIVGVYCAALAIRSVCNDFANRIDMGFVEFTLHGMAWGAAIFGLAVYALCTIGGFLLTLQNDIPYSQGGYISGIAWIASYFGMMMLYVWLLAYVLAILHTKREPSAPVPAN